MAPDGGLAVGREELLTTLSGVGWSQAKAGRRLGLSSRQIGYAIRKYAIVAIFMVAAVITPPDVFSQFALAMPIWGLYELSILLVARIEKARNARAP